MSFPPLLHSIEKKCNELLPGIYVAQPHGKLCYAWFTDVCTIIDRTTKKQWTVPVAFEPCLQGTIVSGVYIDHCFVMDTLYHYKGVALQCTYEEKIKIMKKMVAMEIRAGMFFLPEFSTKASYKHSLKIIQEGITYHYTPKTFQVKSTPKSDIYEVYKDKKLQSIACIDTYSCSLAMNRLFHPTDIFVEKTLTMECKWNETFKKWTPIV
jgi:hypothetical protein